MKALEQLTSHLNERIIELQKAKDTGSKMVGYVPNGYMPTELIFGFSPKAMPIPLLRGGEHEPVLFSGAYIPRWVETFYRAQIGYKMLAENAVYNMVDILISALLDCNQRAMSDTWTYYTGIPAFMFAIPHEKSDIALEYYIEGVNLFKKKLEEITDSSINESKLIDAVNLANKRRALFKELSFMRKANPAPISGLDFVKLNHAAFLADPKYMVDLLEQLVKELKSGKAESTAKGPRIMITGGTLAQGDYKILNLCQNAGAQIVVEYFDIGLQDYWRDIQINADPVRSLAESYFNKTIPATVFRASNERQNFILNLAKEFKVDGIISYELMYAECLQIETFSLVRKLNKENIPVQRIYSDYDPSDTGALKTRVETFVETIRR